MTKKSSLRVLTNVKTSRIINAELKRWKRVIVMGLPSGYTTVRRYRPRLAFIEELIPSIAFLFDELSRTEPAYQFIEHGHNEQEAHRNGKS